jgi:hypothetical protein
MWASTAVEDPRVGLFHLFLYAPILACQCILWPHSRAGDCYVAKPFVCISLMPFLSTTELGTESTAELQTGPATELGSPCSGAGGCPVVEPWAVSILGPTTELGDVSQES